MGLRTTISRTLAGLLCTVLLIAATPAHATTVAEKRAQAAKIQAQIDALDTQVEIAAEDYNSAKIEYDQVTAAVVQNEARLKELVARQAQLQEKLGTRVQGMYRRGAFSYLEVLFGATTFQEFATMWDLLQDMNREDAASVAELKQTRAAAEQVRQELAVQQAQAKAEADTMAARKASIEKQLEDRQRVLAGVNAEISAIIAEQRRAAEAAAAKAAQAAAHEDYGTPSGSAHGSVVSLAMSKLGAPYRWAASGPDSFDCSGFTMWCYAQIGIYLPHSSRSQINCGERVSRSDLEPGDLVFFGSPIHHVGLYVGGGQFIHAPSTGDVVKISSLAARSDYAGACRP